jgi:hypothetical protein
MKTKKINSIFKNEQDSANFRAFLSSRNLLPSSAGKPTFAQNSATKEVMVRNDTDFLFIVSFVPFHICKAEQKLSSNWCSNEDKNLSWIKKELNLSTQYRPIGLPICNDSKVLLKTFQYTFVQDTKFSYTEFQTNGFWEKGICFNSYSSSNLQDCVLYLKELLNFAKKYYQYLKYDKEVFIQVSMKNVINSKNTPLNLVHIEGFDANNATLFDCVRLKQRISIYLGLDSIGKTNVLSQGFLDKLNITQKQ